MGPQKLLNVANKLINYEISSRQNHNLKDNRRNSDIKWKEIMIISFSLLCTVLQPIVSQACELKFAISGEQKESYKAGEELIIEVTIVYTHRTCEIQLSDTKFTYEGMKILGATAWKEKAPNTFSRQIKISLLADALPEARLNIVRKCSKDGVVGTFKISKTS